MRLIDADELKKEVLKWLPSDPCGIEEKEFPFETDIVVSLMMEIEEAPTIEPKRGKWIFKTIFPNDKSEFPMGYLECSVCGSHHSNATPCNYCDNCGADMRNNSEKLNNSTISKMEQVDKDINVRSKNEP